MDLGAVVTGGGSAALLYAGLRAARLALDWWQARQSGEHTDKTVAITSADTANAVILASLKNASEREAQLSGQVEELRAQNGRLYEQMRQQRKDHDTEMAAMRKEYEGEIAELRQQVDDFSDRLADLQQRLRPDQP